VRLSRKFWTILLPLAVSACATWSTTTVKPAKAAERVQEAPAATAPQATPDPTAAPPAPVAEPAPITGPAAPAAPAAVPAEPTIVDGVLVSENDVTDKPYKVLGDIKVTVRKTTIFNADPTRAQVDEKLRKQAKKMGADAVLLVRYGTVGIGLTSWGVLDGQGRAVKFE
jgi:uncharacterized protein YbjQ (UPF0145 family)